MEHICSFFLKQASNVIIQQLVSYKLINFVLKISFYILEEEKERIRTFRAYLKRVLQSNIQHKRSFKLAMNEQ
jgi:hypothetical protein